jgi:hypothetical protein
LDFHSVVSDPWGLRAGFSSELTLDRRDFGINALAQQVQWTSALPQSLHFNVQ